jgi:alkylation response protein AidB-like acyl-CoA dehydrogenase
MLQIMLHMPEQPSTLKAQATKAHFSQTDLTKTLADLSALAPTLDSGNSSLGASIEVLRDAGLLAAPLPYSLGGQNWAADDDNSIQLHDILFALGSVDLSVARVFEGHVNALRLIGLYGSRVMQTATWSVAKEGALFGVWGADGSHPVRINGPVLQGEKIYCSGLNHVQYAVILAKNKHHKTQMVLSDVDQPSRSDMSMWQSSGMRGTGSGKYDMNGISANQNTYIGEADIFFKEPHCQGNLWRLCAIQAGCMSSIAAEFFGFVMSFGDKTSEVQLHRAALTKGHARTAQLWTRSCADDAILSASINARIVNNLLCREMVEHAAEQLMILSKRGMGLRAFVIPNHIERQIRDLSVLLRQASLDDKLAYASMRLGDID